MPHFILSPCVRADQRCTSSANALPLRAATLICAPPGKTGGLLLPFLLSRERTARHAQPPGTTGGLLLPFLYLRPRGGESLRTGVSIQPRTATLTGAHNHRAQQVDR